jgi:hypothetical protein
MPKSSPEYSHALPVMPMALELDEETLLLELPPVPTELEEETPLPVPSELDKGTPPLELSPSFGEDGDSEQAKTVREIAAASVGIVILIMSSP